MNTARFIQAPALFHQPHATLCVSWQQHEAALAAARAETLTGIILMILNHSGKEGMGGADIVCFMGKVDMTAWHKKHGQGKRRRRRRKRGEEGRQEGMARHEHQDRAGWTGVAT